MPVWERYVNDASLSAVGAHSNSMVFENNEDTDNFQNADVVAVDGILTVHTDTDDLMGVRLLVVPTGLVDADLTEDYPRPDDAMMWYSFFAARGPTIFRLKSKKTIPPDYALWIQQWKASGTTATTTRIGLHVLWVLKH